jgi:hypothetical protein
MRTPVPAIDERTGGAFAHSTLALNAMNESASPMRP